MLDDFEDFFRREISSLVSFVRKQGFEIEEARDAAQEAMIMACKKWEHLNSPLAWVRIAAKGAAMRNAERQRAGTACAIRNWEQTPATPTDPAELLEGHGRALILLDCLPTQQREVMAWYLDGFETHEIARHLGVSESTVRSSKRHARNLLKKKLADLGRLEAEGHGHGAW